MKVDHLAFDKLLPEFATFAELRVVWFILRATYGFSQKWRRISLDEFRFGRKRKGGMRFNKGTGLSENGVRQGIAAALEDGLIRVKK